MKNLSLMIAMVAIAAFMSACGQPAANTNTNTNSNANAKPVAAAPTVETFLEMEKKANEAYAKGDGAYFETMLSDKVVMSMGKEHMGKAALVSMIKTAKCEMKDGVKISEPQLSKIDNDTYAFTYKNDTAGTCTENGKSVEMKPMRASTVWVRNGEKWQAAWHSETPIMAAPAGEKKDAAKAEEPKKDDKAAEPKKEEKAEDKKADDKSAEKKDEAKPASNTAAETKPEAPKASANTDALVKAHASGWEAFRNKDAKAFDTMLASTFALVGPDGSYVSSKSDAIKTWTETMKCEGITKTSVSDGFSTSVSPTVEILHVKGSSDGTCDGQKLGALWQTAVYVKEGDTWKLAFMFETPEGA